MTFASLRNQSTVSAMACFKGVSFAGPKVLLLLVLSERKQCSQAELAAALDVEPPTVSSMVTKLEAAGTLSRTPSSDDRRQAVALRLTAQRDPRNSSAYVQRSGPSVCSKLRFPLTIYSTHGGLLQPRCMPHDRSPNSQNHGIGIVRSV